MSEQTVEETQMIAAAVERLDAVRLADGDYAYRAEETARWYVVTESDLRDLGERMARGESDAYSHWCARDAGSAAPDWIVEEITPTADALVYVGAYYRLHVTIRNLSANGERQRWTVRDVSDPRYDISGAKIDPRAARFVSGSPGS